MKKRFGLQVSAYDIRLLRFGTECQQSQSNDRRIAKLLRFGAESQQSDDMRIAELPCAQINTRRTALDNKKHEDNISSESITRSRCYR